MPAPVAGVRGRTAGVVVVDSAGPDDDLDPGRIGEAIPRTYLSVRHFVPLVGFVVPTVVIGYGFVIPGSCIAGVNELTVGFGSAIAGACISYWLGLRSLVRESKPTDEA